jgi:hypothetical protein
MREQMGLPNGGLIALEISDEGQLVLRAHQDNHKHD